MVANPNPARITDASWWLMQQLLALQPGTRNGGIYANKPGYHNTRAGNWSGDYSVTDAVDKRGPSDKAAAYDWTFTDAQAGRYDLIMKYTNRLLRSARDPDDPRLNGWREFYGQADADRQVEGWDTRYGYAASSDPSHLWHLHFSETRALVADYDNKRALLSVLRGETVAEWRGDDMPTAEEVAKAVVKALTQEVPEGSWADAQGLLEAGRAVTPQTALRQAWAYGKAAYLSDAELHGKVDGLLVLVRQLLADSDLSEDQYQELLARVEAASRAGAAEVAERLAAAGAALVGDDGEA